MPSKFLNSSRVLRYQRISRKQSNAFCKRLSNEHAAKEIFRMRGSNLNSNGMWACDWHLHVPVV